MKYLSAVSLPVFIGLCAIECLQGLQANQAELVRGDVADSNSSSWSPFDWFGGSSSGKAAEENVSGEPLPINVVAVEMYYEALCPFCRTIIGGPLAELYNDSNFTQRINITFYPYGNSMSVLKQNLSEGYKYWHQELNKPGMDHIYLCQHGPDECFGNMLHVCAIEELGNKSTPFIMCMESYDEYSSEASSYLCADIMNVSLDPVRACVEGSKGNKKMVEVGERTENLKKPAGPHEYVPWMTLDGVHCPNCELDGEDGAKGHILHEICSILNEPKPSLCTGSKDISFRAEHHSLDSKGASNEGRHSNKIEFRRP